MKLVRTVTTSFLVIILAACASVQAGSPATDQAAAPTAAEVTSVQPVVPTETSTPQLVETVEAEAPSVTPPAAPDTPTEPPSPTGTPEPAPTLGPDDWKELPVVPEGVSDRVLEIYQRGLESGNNPQAFSNVGDCGGTPAWFLGDFDRGPKYYRLGDYEELQPTIEYFAGSFDRTSLAAKEGFTTSSMFTVLWADRSQCSAGETPLVCEYRVHRPIAAFIMLGTNDVWHEDRFEPQMRKIIEYSIENGVIPILSTKADNREGDGSINATIARLAQEYELPLWNYWLAVQPLPDQGLQDDGAHITWAPNRFDDPKAMQRGWPVRNLTALQMLDLIRRSVGQ
jgi:hypothetical protein